MDRRGFLQGLAAALATPVVALVPSFVPQTSAQARAWLEFDSRKEYGVAVSAPKHGEFSEPFIERVAQFLRADARETLPPGTRFAVVDCGESDFGNIQSFAWYYGSRRHENVICEAVA